MTRTNQSRRTEVRRTTSPLQFRLPFDDRSANQDEEPAGGHAPPFEEHPANSRVDSRESTATRTARGRSRT